MSIASRTLRPLLLSATLAACCADPALATLPPPWGPTPEGVAQAYADGVFSLPARLAQVPPTDAASPPPLRLESVQASWNIPVILVSFADDTLVHDAADFSPMLFGGLPEFPTGSVSEYWRWASRGQVQITGRVVARLKLSETAAFYARNNRGLTATGTPRNAYGMVREALSMCQSQVAWQDFDRDRDGYVDMLWVVHAGVGGEVGDRNRLQSITSRMSIAWTNGNVFVTTVEHPPASGRMMRLDRFTVLPEMSAFRPGQLSEIGVYAHEFGHALGLPDLYDVTNPSNTGPGNWSLMASGGYGGDGVSPEYPTHPGAWALQFLGWDETLKPDRDTTLTLEPITSTGRIVDLWFQGEDHREHFLIEHRRRAEYDRNLPGEGLLVYQIDDAVIGQRLFQNTINSGLTPGLRLVEADGDNDLVTGWNRGDDMDPFPGGLNRTFVNDNTLPSLRTFTGSATQLTLSAISSRPEWTRFNAYVRSPGWLPPEDWTGANYTPFQPQRSAPVTGTDDAGRHYVVMNEIIDGRQQVVLRTSDAWDRPLILSASPGAAQEPTLAVLPGGDLAVAWSDTRQTPTRIYYRTRIRGTWTSERPILALPGNCRSPAIGADRRGGVVLAFQYAIGDSVELRFAQFPYTSPFGAAQEILLSDRRPENPLVLVEPEGAAYILWQERTPPQQLWFARYHPDSGLGTARTLTLPSAYPHTGFSAVVDRDRALHVVWQTIGVGGSEIRYQRRAGAAFPNPIDQIVEVAGAGLAGPRIAVDPDRNLHMVFERAGSGGSSIRYRLFTNGSGWDAGSTDLLYPTPLGGSRPFVFPENRSRTTVVYTGTEGGSQRFMVRKRNVDGTYITSVPAPSNAQPGLLAAPNPLRAGNALEVWSPEPGETFVFDIAGREVGRMQLTRAGTSWRGRLSGAHTASWRSGVYFLRPGAAAGRGRSIVVLN